MTAAVTAATTRQRILDAAVELVTVSGWSSITMGGLAEHAGVSRQTVYNEIGSKQALADAVVLDELGRFLALVDTAFDRNTADLRAALHAAVLAVLDRARDSALLRAIVTSTTGAGTELLPPLTTRSSSLIDTAKQLVVARLAAYGPAVDDRALAATVDMLVRTVLSHVVQPSGTPEHTAAGVADAVVRALRPEPA